MERRTAAVSEPAIAVHAERGQTAQFGADH